ncbi:receptor-like protein 56 [Impatiens glandulifera]|uniref:receptor-like protein 56 n=1 Tax=Impatiens glandulifera TaxID=253017 RepID=UPI001FB0A2D9|nr:receptor-like protein 56 [Impatiens glandulifera]
MSTCNEQLRKEFKKEFAKGATFKEVQLSNGTGDLKFFTTILRLNKWLTDVEMNAAICLLRARAFAYPKSYPADFTILDCQFGPLITSYYDNFVADSVDPEKPHGHTFDQIIYHYYWGREDRHMPGWSSVDVIYFPLNLNNLHWGDKINGRHGCIVEERKGLLQLKAKLGSRMNQYFNSSFLPSWVDDQTGVDCCDWERVTCDPVTGHVLKLSLDYIYGFNQNNNLKTTNWSTSSTAQDIIGSSGGFEKLSQLENLDISGNQLDASVLSSLSTIKSLKVLDLSYNSKFKDSLSSQGFEKLSVLKQLKNLYIKDMELDTSVLPSLSTIKSLKLLDLTRNNLLRDHFSSQDCEALLGLRNLEELSLADNNMYNGQIKINMSCLGSLPSFKSLSLDKNYPQGDSSSLTKGLEGLQQLQVLSMSFCGLTTKDVKSLSKMGKLMNLDLSNNHLKKDVLMELRALPSLQFLNLSLNLFQGPFTNPDLNGFDHLEILNIAGCGLNGTIPAQSICKMKKLKELDLSRNLFEGGIPSCLKELSYLRRLDLSHNQLSGNLPSSMFRDLNLLEYIGLGYNSFQGTFLFNVFANFSKLEEVLISNNNDKLVVETEQAEWVPKFQLKTLVLSNCSLNILSGGTFPKFLLYQKNLLTLDLSHNRLGGSFPNWLLVNNTRIQLLYLQDNNFGGSLYLPETKSEIKELDISNNELKGHIQDNIGQLLPLTINMDISFNAFDGDIPRSLGNMSSLGRLTMSNNNLVGEVPIEIMSIHSLQVLDLSSNHLSGFSNFNWSIGTNLIFIDISHNKMSGHIPISTDNSIDAILMRNNSFSGPFSCELVAKSFLDISYNSFTGELPSCSGFKDLKHLNLYGNKFTGMVPEAILNSSSLKTLDIGENLFSGLIPPDLITGLSNIQILSLRGNQFNGAIPHQLCQLENLNWLDLSHNFFSGSIPTCFGNINFGVVINDLRDVYTLGSSLIKLQDHNLQLTFRYMANVVIFTKNRVDTYIGKPLELMSGLDLSSNNLEGEIPDVLGNLIHIRALNLSRNWLRGHIPQNLSNLMQIESLDLSHNNLTGEIPSKLTNLNRLGTFSVAYNNLSGRLPEMGQFATFEGNSYVGNPFLCGPPLKKDCKVQVNNQVKNDDDDDDGDEAWYTINIEAFFASFMGSYIVCIFGFFAVLWINARWRDMWFNLIDKILFSSYSFLSNTLYKCFRVQI